MSQQEQEFSPEQKFEQSKKIVEYLEATLKAQESTFEDHVARINSLGTIFAELQELLALRQLTVEKSSS